MIPCALILLTRPGVAGGGVSVAGVLRRVPPATYIDGRQVSATGGPVRRPLLAGAVRPTPVAARTGRPP